MFSWKKIGRKNPRLKEFDYSTPGMYFITIVARKRECWFGEVVGADVSVGPAKMKFSDFGTMVDQCWRMLPNKFANVRLDEFVVMPNHIHGIIEILSGRDGVGPTETSAPTKNARTPPHDTSIPDAVRWFKSLTTQKFIKYHKQQGRFFDGRLWQRRYHDRILRSGEIEIKRGYIRNNPKKWEQDRLNRSK